MGYTRFADLSRVWTMRRGDRHDAQNLLARPGASPRLLLHLTLVGEAADDLTRAPPACKWSAAGGSALLRFPRRLGIAQRLLRRAARRHLRQAVEGEAVASRRAPSH